MPGRAFLNKKEFHTGSFKNMESVWIAEQKKLQQDKQFLEQKKRLLEEKYSEELKRMQVKAGLLPESALNKMEWMYRYNLAEDNQNIAEDYLLGKAVDPKKGINPLEQEKKQVKVQFDENDVFMVERQEQFVRLYEDPMFLMMKEKRRRKEEIYNNPIMMQKLFEKMAFEKAKNHVKNIEHLLKKKKTKSTQMVIEEKLKSEYESKQKQVLRKLQNKDDLRRSLGFNVPRKPGVEKKKREEDDGKEKKTRKEKKSKKLKKSKKIKKKEKKKGKKRKKKKEKSTTESDQQDASGPEEESLTEKLFSTYMQRRVGPNVEVDMETGRLKFKNKKRRKKRNMSKEEEARNREQFRNNHSNIYEAKERFLKGQIKDEEIKMKKSNPDFLNRVNQDAFVKKYGVKF